MAAKGYCEWEAVEAHLGATFSAAQASHAQDLIEAAEIHLDEETGRGWLVDPQLAEAFYWPGYEIWLQYAPVASVEAVRGRDGIGEAETVLTVDEDYEVLSLAAGRLMLVAPLDYDRVTVDYTPVDTVPADVRQATIELVAAWLQPALQPGSFGLDSYSLPDLTVRFARTHVQAAAPPYVQRVIERYRYPVVG